MWAGIGLDVLPENTSCLIFGCVVAKRVWFPGEVDVEVTPVTDKSDDDQGNALPGVIAFWFAWYVFHPDTGVYRAD